jgi:hypothetical protein
MIPGTAHSGIVDRAAAEDCIRSHVEPVGAIETSHERPWATVLRVPLADGVAWFKSCAPVQAFEPRLTAGLWGALTRFRHLFPGLTRPSRRPGGAVLFWSLCYLVLRRVLQLAALRCRSEEFKELEIVVLRHELAVLRRQVGRPELRPADRVFLADASRLLARGSWRSFVVTPTTLLRWPAGGEALGPIRVE